MNMDADLKDIGLDTAEKRKSYIHETTSGRYYRDIGYNMPVVLIVEQYESLEVQVCRKNPAKHRQCRIFDNEGYTIFEGRKPGWRDEVYVGN